MKRAPSQDLFKLIKSLSKGEKRNFKLLAGLLASEKDKKYIELFDLIDKQEVYNETKIAKVMKDLYGGQLAVGKHYLHRLILKSLVHYRYDAGTELHNLTEQVRVLLEKDLFMQAGKLLRKGIHEAEVQEEFATQYTLLQLQLDLYHRNPNSRRFEEEVSENTLAKRAVLDKIENLDRYRDLWHRILAVSKSRSQSGTASQSELLADIANAPLLMDPSEAKSTRALLEFHTIHRKLSSLKGDLQATIAQSIRILEIYDLNLQLKEELIRNYFTETSNLCTYYLRAGDVKRALAKMEEFKEYRILYPKARIDFFMLYYVLLIASSMQIGEPERALAMVPEIEAEVAALEEKIPKAHKTWLQYFLAYAFLMQGKPKMALSWLKPVLVENRNELSVDLQCDARILHMMVQFGLANYSVVESEYVNTRRFLEKHGQYSDYNRLTLRGLRALAMRVDGPGYADVKLGWMQRFRKWEAADAGNTKATIDFGAWLEAQITGETMAVVRKRNLTANQVVPMEPFVVE